MTLGRVEEEVESPYHGPSALGFPVSQKLYAVFGRWCQLGHLLEEPGPSKGHRGIDVLGDRLFFDLVDDCSHRDIYITGKNGVFR